MDFGISETKLLHAVITFKDTYYGPGNWHWNMDLSNIESKIGQLKQANNYHPNSARANMQNEQDAGSSLIAGQ